VANLQYESFYKARKFIVNQLAIDLVGPSSENEIINEQPTDFYITGILYPQHLERKKKDNSEITAHFDNQHDETDEDDYGSADIPVSMANSSLPSSMGITFAVDTISPKQLKVSINIARYEPINTSSIENIENFHDKSFDDDSWKRIRIPIENLIINVPGSGDLEEKKLYEGLLIKWIVRPQSNDNKSIVTISLVNNNKSSYDERARFAYFQPEIIVNSYNSEKNIFVETTHKIETNDNDSQSADLLYRNARIFAMGHGCSGSWESNKLEDKAYEIRTTLVPEFEFNLTDSNSSIESNVLSMNHLKNEVRSKIISELRDFVHGYESWIETIHQKVSLLDKKNLQETAYRHIENATTAKKRMLKGIEILEQHDDVWEAFRLSNSAMLFTRSRDSLNKNISTEIEISDDAHQWYPFQLAFILLCIEGVAFPESNDRNLLDLLWFPTGGGKTEAYFGVISFTIFLRRLRNQDNGGGVTAMMRYTLRLLTLQQFQRATLMICACENLRSTRSDLGKTPITIGLYVGDVTPRWHNTTSYSMGTRKALKLLKNNTKDSELDKSNPMQIHNCPWCQTKIIIDDYALMKDSSGNEVLEIRCHNSDCPFSPKGKVKKLPVFLIDEDVYNHRPTLLIATVDKFANIAWGTQHDNIVTVPNLFNIDYADPPPELIVQDELHLMSGPLGTITGLYETAIDILCEYNGNKPKIIASTATIRNATQQSKTLFARTAFQFPPPGIDAEDSYFAQEVPSDKKGNRLYVGLFAPGTSQATLMIRTYASLLQSGQVLNDDENVENDVKDAYWTLVGYFNTRRLLGSALIQVSDDVDKRLIYLSNHNIGNRRELGDPMELSGRTGSGDLNNKLEQISEKVGSDDCVDVILATNMISVGVDINRWGVMPVMGQPLSTSEYIQATSRVGRQYPGLAIIIFNHAKSRDRSHYEAFKSHHLALYRQVEATSVTPFSPRARDKALHAVLISLLTILYKEYRNYTYAIVELKEKAEYIKNQILKRVSDISDSDMERDETEKDLNDLIAHWYNSAIDNELMPKYSEKGTKNFFPLIKNAGNFKNNSDENTTNKSWPTMRSFRDVDTESQLYIGWSDN